MKTPRLHSSAARMFPVALGALLLVPSAARAQTAGTWISNTAGGNWSDVANWTSGAVPDAAGDSATFTAITAGNSGRIVTLDESVTLGSLALLETGSGAAGYGGWIISGGDLTLASGSSTIPVINVTGANSSNTISSTIHGTQGFTKTGTGNLVISGDNDYTGLTTLTSANVFLYSATGFGATGSGNGTLIDQSGTSYPQLHLGNNVSSAEDLMLSARVSSTTGGATVGSTFLFNDSGNSTLSGNISLARTSTSANGQNNVDSFGVQSTGGVLTLAGNISGTLSAGAYTGVQATGTYANPNVLRLKSSTATSVVNITGTISDGTIGTGGISLQTDANSNAYGLVRLSGANTYSGDTVHNAGILLVNNTGGSGTGTGSVSVASGATFGGTGIVAPTGSHGVTFAAGSVVAPGDLDDSGVAIAAGKSLTFDLSSTTGAVTFASGATVSINLNAAAIPSAVSESLSFVGLAGNPSQVVFNNNVVNFSITGGLLADGIYTIASFDADGSYTGQLVLGTGLESYGDARLIQTAGGIELAIGSAIPEPATTALILGALAIGGACLARRRRC